MTFQQRYQYNVKSDLLGRGGFARVYKARDILLDRDVAIKVFNATESGLYTVIDEIKKAIRLQHPNVLRYYDVAVVETTNALDENNTMQIGVMEYANSGDLRQFARKNPGSPLFFQLLNQVLSGLEYLHRKGILHRDLKPQNILLVEEDGELTAKICDFGISKSMNTAGHSASMTIGTIEYMAPEQFSPAKYGLNGKIGTSVDLWSFGVMVHELITGTTIFGQRSGNTTAEEIMNAILSNTLPIDIENLPEPYKTIVKKCLVTDARQRIQTARELMVVMENARESTAIAAVSLPPINLSLRKENIEDTFLLDKSLISKTASDDTQLLDRVALPEADPQETRILDDSMLSRPAPDDTLLLDKSILAAHDSDEARVLDTSTLPGIDANETQLPDKFPLIKEKMAPAIDEKPITGNTAMRKKKWPYIVTAIIVVIAAALSIFKWKSDPDRKLSAAEEYTLSTQIGSDTNGVFLPGLKKAAGMGYDSAQWQLARYFLKHNKQDDAMPYLKKLADTLNGNADKYPDMFVTYAGLLLQGKHNEEAVALLRYGAGHNNAECAYQLGMYFYNQSNYVSSLKWLKVAGNKGYDKALGQLGTMYFMRDGITEDDNTADAIAINYCFKAADLGNSVAMYSLGLAYKTGKGVPVNKQLARGWFRKVIEKGDNPEAINSARQQLGQQPE